MHKNKKILAVLSTAAITGLMVTAVNSTTFAKTTAIAVNSSDGKVYEYQYDALKASAVSQLSNESSNSDAKLYNDFLQRKTNVKAYYDDVNKSYIDFDTISKEVLNSVEKGILFNLDSFTESSNTPTTTLTSNKVSIDTNGNLTINGQIVNSSTVDKPTVKSITVIDSETITVRFSKDVNQSYARNISNYKLVDSKNVDITDHIEGIYSYKGETDTSDTDTYKIKIKEYNPNDLNDDWRLTNSKYILTIKNIIDTSSVPNKMDDYTYILNSANADTSAPTVTGIYKTASSNSNKVIVYFSEAMDSNTLINKDNYAFINGQGDTKSLPSDATILVGGDNKSVIIEFSSNYHVLTNTTASTGNFTDITELAVSNVKDEAGNMLNGISYKSGISAPASSGTYVKNNTLKVYYNGDDLKVDVCFSRAIDDYSIYDFTFGGVTPDSAVVDGNMVTLTFKAGAPATASEIAAHPITYANGKINTNPTKIDIIKSQGQSAKLAINPTVTTDETGALVSSPLSDAQTSVYDYEAAPRTTCFDNNNKNPNYWMATKDSNGGKVYITFDTPLNVNSGISSDDVIFYGLDGTDIRADSVFIDPNCPNTIIFSFNTSNKNYNAFKGDLNITISTSITLKSKRDVDGNCAAYIPSSNDLKTRRITINN